MKCSGLFFKSSIIFLVLFGLGCGAQQHVVRMNTTIKAYETPNRNEVCYVLVSEDVRDNAYNLENFDRAWGYSVDANYQNKINFSSENPISSILTELIKGTLKSMGYDAVLIQKKDEVIHPESNPKIIVSYIDRFWINCSSPPFGGLRLFETDICIRMEVHHANSSALPKQLRIETYNKDYRGAFLAKTIKEKTEEVLSVNIERLKENILEKLEKGI
jgi:hypothetical protein